MLELFKQIKEIFGCCLVLNIPDIGVVSDIIALATLLAGWYLRHCLSSTQRILIPDIPRLTLLKISKHTDIFSQ